VFYKFKTKTNYSGRFPDLMKYMPFIRYIEEVLAPELLRMPKALIVPCGELVSEALCYLAKRRIVKDERCLLGFPHASAQNRHRQRHFNERQDGMRARLSAWAAVAQPRFHS
jgi:hypothetical protein